MKNAQCSENCVICYEDREDFRMLPCWHVACFSCICRMTQTEQGRPVKCHLCREPYLFENVRSLPRPVVCRLCSKTATNATKFPCGPQVYCTECASNLREIENGIYLCPASCKDISHSRNDLLQAKICPMCFCMHSSEGLNCGHNICSGCKQVLLAQQRKCLLCLAVNAPMPVPVNPFLPSNGNAVNSVNNLPLLGSWEQRFLRMQLRFVALQIARARQQRNQQVPHQQLSRQARLQRTQKILEKYMAEDLPKVGIALALFIIFTFFWGFNFWIWAVLTFLLSALRPIKEYNQRYWVTFAVLMYVHAVWNYFFYSISFIAFELVFGLISIAVGRCFPNSITSDLIKAIKIIPIYHIFPAVFVHIALNGLGLSISNHFARLATID